jgi:chromosome partitioning protein
MQIIAVLSQKGGVGKSMVASALAVAFAHDDTATLLIDLDPQATNAKWGRRREASDPVVLSAHASMLDDEVAKARAMGCEVLILDTAPHSNDTALKVAKIADLVVVPCGVSIDDIEAIPSTLDVIKFAGVPYFIVLNNVETTTKAELADAATTFEELGAPLCPMYFAKRVAFKRARQFGLTAQEYVPDGKKVVDEKAAEEIHSLYTFTRRALDVSTPRRDDMPSQEHVDTSAEVKAPEMEVLYA